MLLSSNLWVEPAFPHSHSFKLTEQVRDKWVKAEGQTLRTFIPPGGAQSVWGFLVTNEGIHEVHYDTGWGIRTDVHCSPWIFNILWLSGFILRRNLSQLGESVAHLGPAVSQQPLSPPASHWLRPRKPVIVHGLSGLSRLASMLHLFASDPRNFAWMWDSLLTSKFFHSPPLDSFLSFNLLCSLWPRSLYSAPILG